jgi:hypothetical protein
MGAIRAIHIWRGQPRAHSGHMGHSHNSKSIRNVGFYECTFLTSLMAFPTTHIRVFNRNYLNCFNDKRRNWKLLIDELVIEIKPKYNNLLYFLNTKISISR